MSRGAYLIATERSRQVLAEGWTPDHDAEHTAGELALAATCYVAHVARPQRAPFDAPPPLWPWDAHYWKPSDDPIRNLVKAGALIAAEIDRLAASQETEQ